MQSTIMIYLSVCILSGDVYCDRYRGNMVVFYAVSGLR